MQVQEIAIKDIVVEHNSRKLFDKAELEKLALSLKYDGQLQPIVVKPANGKGKFILVAGERRCRAAKLLGWEKIRAQVSEAMGDLEIERARLAENFARTNLHPIEEADQFKRLIERGLTPKGVAEQTGESLQKVLSRLHLTELAVEVRQEALRPDSNVPHAFLWPLAKLGPSVQRQVLKQIMAGEPRDKRPLTLPEVEKIVAGYQRTLAAAQFDLADPNLLPEAGSCLECPYNTRNQPREIYGKAVDVCLAVDCFADKSAELMKRWLVEQDAKALPKTAATDLLSRGSYTSQLGRHPDYYEDVDKNKPWSVPFNGSKTLRTIFNGEEWPQRYLGIDVEGRIRTFVRQKDSEAILERIRRRETNFKTARSPREVKQQRQANAIKRVKKEIRQAAVEKLAAGGIPKLHQLELVASQFRDYRVWHTLARIAKERGIELTAKEKHGTEGWNRDAVVGRKVIEAALAEGQDALIEMLARVRLETWAENTQHERDLEELGCYVGIDAKARMAELVKEAEQKARKQVKDKSAKANGKPAKRVAKPKRGVCRVCGCTEANACMLRPLQLALDPPQGGALGEPCSWTDRSKTLCSGCQATPRVV